eukprot:scaffold13497_cov155-Skeletonema_dohrnii-CCMP3373.AAC.8
MQSPFDLSLATPSLRGADSIAVLPRVEHGRTIPDIASSASGRKYSLEKIIQVDGRQGIATNGTHYFVSSSTALFMAAYVEWFGAGRGQDIQIVLYDAETLDYSRSVPWNEDSGQVECGAITIDVDNELVWMSDWVHSNYVYKYDLHNGEYVGKLHLRATPEWTQGLVITADDGDADRKEPDNLWFVPKETLLNNATYISHEKAFDVPPFLDHGEIEGLDFNTATNQMIVHANRGMRIVLGMPQGYYPGYTREIHELHVFNIIDGNDASSAADGTYESE